MPRRFAQDVELVSHGADVRLLLSLPSALREMLARHLLGIATSWRFVAEKLRTDLASALPPDLSRGLERMSRVEAPLFSLPRDLSLEQRIIDGEGAFVVSIGRLLPTKHVEKAITHAARRGQRLIVIGDGPERVRLERLGRSVGATTFLGQLPRDQALAWLASSQGLLFASVEEGSPTVWREAEALGVPVIDLR